MDFIIELLGAVLELYVEFFTSSVPDKDISKGKRIFLKVLFTIISLAIIACLVIGIIMIASRQSDVEMIVGIVLLALAGSGILAHIIMVLRNVKKNKNLREPLSKEDIEDNNKLLK
ncbi:MAG: hypothetical protein K2I23_07535 [Clostridia bacterium]|nr:hypothetical protein [Clostridia bacterium]